MRKPHASTGLFSYYQLWGKSVQMDILAYRYAQTALSRLGNATRCHAAGAFWGVPALLATPARLPRRSFGHLRQLLGNTSRRPLP